MLAKTSKHVSGSNQNKMKMDWGVFKIGLSKVIFRTEDSSLTL